MFIEKIKNDFLHIDWVKAINTANSKYKKIDSSDELITYIAADAMLKYNLGERNNVQSWYINLDEHIINSHSFGYWRTKYGIDYLKLLVYVFDNIKAKNYIYSIVAIKNILYVNEWDVNFNYKNYQLDYHFFENIDLIFKREYLNKYSCLIVNYLDYIVSKENVDIDELDLINNIELRTNVKEFHQIYHQLKVSGTQILENLHLHI